MKVTRIARLLKVLQILQSGSGHNSKTLSEECKVSRRTTFRDIESLRAAGLPFEFDPGRDRYSLPSAYFLPPVNFTAAEAISLVALANELGRGDRLPFFEPAQSAAIKLESSLPPPLRRELGRITRAIRIEPMPINPLDGKRGIFHQLVDAMADYRVVLIDYDGLAESKPITTKLRPYHLIFRRHSWYVIGRSSIHSEVRTFNLSRIAALVRLDKCYSVPRGFSIERYLGNAWHLTPEHGADQQVVIRFSPLVAQTVADVKWHKTQQHQFEVDGSLVFQAKVSGLNEIVWWILSYGDQAEVIQPERLRRFVAQRARNMVSRYDRAL